MNTANLTSSSSQPDPKVLDALALFQRLALGVVWLIAGVILISWLAPGPGYLLPGIWQGMKQNTAICSLLCAASLTLQQPKRRSGLVRLAKVLALVVAGIAAFSLLEYQAGRSLGSEHWFAVSWVHAPVGRMSLQGAASFMGLSLLLLSLRVRKHVLSPLVDALALLQLFLICAILSGYVFGVMSIFGMQVQNRVSPQTLLCLGLLSLVAFTRRAEYGIFSILLGVGIGSRISRIAAPIAVFMPFSLEMARLHLVRYQLARDEFASATVTSISALVAFCLIVALTWRIWSLEREVHDLSLRDELTRVYNRRGFYLLADQALRLARRSEAPFGVVFIDLDGLKRINDLLGHDVGSEFVCDVAHLLRTGVREVDVVGRLGGDEFAVAGGMTGPDVRTLLVRLAEATAKLNGRPSRQYAVSYSVGFAVSREDGAETLEQLLESADKMMYEAKRARKVERRVSGVMPAAASTVVRRPTAVG